MSLLCNFYYWWRNWQISWIKRPHKKLNLRGIWICAFAYEQIQLARGICENSDNDTIRFIRISVISKGHTVTYRLLCVNNCPQNLNPNIYRITVGGNHINYPLDVSTPTSDLITSNIVFNSFVCSPGARYHPTIQIDRLGRNFFVYCGFLRNVWLTSGWKNCQWTPYQASRQNWILTMPINSWSLS